MTAPPPMKFLQVPRRSVVQSGCIMQCRDLKTPRFGEHGHGTLLNVLANVATADDTTFE